jgi:hypothetical protein
VKRWVWNIVCALSLLILAASVTLWVRSYFVGEAIRQTKEKLEPVDEVMVIRRSVIHSVAVARGSVRLSRFVTVGNGLPLVGRNVLRQSRTLLQPTKPGWDYLHWDPGDSLISPPAVDDLHKFRFWGFQFQNKAQGGSRRAFITEDRIVLPLWVFLIFAVPPMVWWRGRRKVGRRGFEVEVAGASGELRNSNDEAMTKSE